jgi:hypothetical protein
MFGFELNALQYAGLTPEQQTTLVNLVSTEKEYLEACLELNSLRMQALTNPCQKTQEAVEDYTSTVVAPLRDNLTSQRRALLTEAVDLNGVLGTLSFAGVGLLNHVNLPLLLEALGIDSDHATKALAEITTFLQKGMAK